MSRGPGRLQRRLYELLEAAPERRMSRAELDQILVKAEHYDPSNVLRAVRGLERNHLVRFADRRHKEDAVISLPRPVKVLSDDEIGRLLTEIGEDRR